MQILRWLLPLFLFYSFLHVFSHSLTAAQQTIPPPLCSEVDRAALIGFKATIFKDTTDILSSWLGKDCCSGDWAGVQCNPATGRVTHLELQGTVRDNDFYMKGTLSPSLGNLYFLEVMVITGMKRISGSIPETFSNLHHLTQLVLEDNSLHGSIPPGLSQLSQLTALSISGNYLTGHIPPSLGSFKRLQLLNLARNSLTGPIPSTLGNLISLQSLDLSFNLLSGFVPDILGQLQNLTLINLSNNQLSGQIPDSVFNMPQLQELSLDNNQLEGKIPGRIGSLVSLTHLSLGSNRFNGQIPFSISKLHNLWYLNLSANGFSGTLPDFLGRSFTSLLSIDLSYNNLSLGTVPDWIKNKQVSDVHLAGCKLRGNVPIFANPDSLSALDLSDNLLTNGISSDFFFNMSNLQNLKLSNNQLKFDLSAIKLPDGISSVDLHSNQLTGLLSGVLNNRTSSFLQFLDVSHNQISGTIPEFAEGLSLKVLNIGGNKITGNVPGSISNLNGLERFDISRNKITGTIPSSLGLLENLQWLDLSINSLSGEIPTTLLKVKTLRHGNFRSNKLCGEIPQRRPYNIFPAKAYAHNLCLCGKPLSPCKV